MLNYLFISLLLAMVITKLWLASRQIRHVTANRSLIPKYFSESITLKDHQRATDYALARTKLSIIETLAQSVLLIALTLMGGLQILHLTVSKWLGDGYIGQITLISMVLLIFRLADLPFSYIRQFIIEQRFGFNRMSFALFVTDMLKGSVLVLILGLPILFFILWVMQETGSVWWLYTWLVWVSFNFFLILLYPTVVAPIFNKFEPLRDPLLTKRIEGLMKRCGFSRNGLFSIDSSRRSTHGNAYCTGFGPSKRIVFFDTLIERLSHAEIESILAHELGHFKQQHVTKRLIAIFMLSLAFLFLLDLLAYQTWFYTNLGIQPSIRPDTNNALKLILFFLIFPVFGFFAAPISRLTSQKQEFEADAFAAKQTKTSNLVDALVKLYKENGSILTSDSIYASFYYSHPPASQRINRLLEDMHEAS